MDGQAETGGGSCLGVVVDDTGTGARDEDLVVEGAEEKNVG